MRASAPRLYIVTDRNATGGRTLVSVVRESLAGLGEAASHVAVQLREKDLPARALVDLARELREVTRAAGAALFVNDRVDVALAVGADGVHLGSGGLAPADVRAITRAADRVLRVGASTHTPAEVAAAAEAGADFVVFGPIFDTPSKRGVLAPVGLDGLRRACAAAAVPVLAIGGVEPTRAQDCVRAGAAGLACVRSVMAATDPTASARMFLSCFKL